MKLTDWLAAKLEEKDLSARDLANISGLSHANISRVLSGKQPKQVAFKTFEVKDLKGLFLPNRLA